MTTESRADTWIRQEPNTVFDDTCIVLFKDSSVARWAANDLGGWYAQQLTPQQFLQVQRLVDGFRPVEGDEPHWVDGVLGVKAAMMRDEAGRVHFVTVDRFVPGSLCCDVVTERGFRLYRFTLSPSQGDAEIVRQMHRLGFVFVGKGG